MVLCDQEKDQVNKQEEAEALADLAYWQELADAVPGWHVMGWTRREGCTYITAPGQWGPDHPDTVQLTGAQRDQLVGVIRLTTTSR
jgi:hypothetical protein